MVLGASLYATALLTTSTMLPQMQGAMSATQDEIAWAMTFNILATAVVTPMTGWLVARFGSQARDGAGRSSCFSVATLLCGLAQSLEMLVLWRIVQGGAGAPVVPLSQTILLNTFPRRQHPMVLSIFGMAVGVAPVFGPVLGGYLAEAYGWRWAFHMLVPVGLLAFVGLRLALPADTEFDEDPARLDRIPGAGDRHGRGAAGACARRAARLVPLDRDHRSNAWWRRSPSTCSSCTASPTKAPFLNLRLLTDRNYAVGLVLVTIYGMLNFTPMVLLPPLLQQHAGFPDALVGQVIGCRGIGMTVGFLTAGLISRLDPRIGMSVGFLMQVASGLWMLTLDLNVTMEILVWNSLIQGFSVGIIWVPLSVVAFDTLAPSDRAEASAVFHLLRNIGSSFFISLSIAEIVRATGANYSRMTEMISPYNTTLSLPWVTGRVGLRQRCRASPKSPRKSTARRP